MSEKGLFKGFSQLELLTMEPRLMCAVLAEQLSRTNQVVLTQAEEIKQLKEKQNKE